MTTSAKYGRMALGRCVKRNYGYLGCALDALAYVDAKCSGRRQCSFSVYEDSLRELQPCPEDISAYLEASYSCQKGEIMPETLISQCSSMILLLHCETERSWYCTHCFAIKIHNPNPKNYFFKCCLKNYGVEEGNFVLSLTFLKYERFFSFQEGFFGQFKLGTYFDWGWMITISTEFRF